MSGVQSIVWSIELVFKDILRRAGIISIIFVGEVGSLPGVMRG